MIRIKIAPLTITQRKNCNMKALIQRVTSASVSVAGEVVGQIDHGLLVLLGVEATDTVTDIAKLAHKVCHYRVFADAEGKRGGQFYTPKSIVKLMIEMIEPYK